MFVEIWHWSKVNEQWRVDRRLNNFFLHRWSACTCLEKNKQWKMLWILSGYPGLLFSWALISSVCSFSLLAQCTACEVLDSITSFSTFPLFVGLEPLLFISSIWELLTLAWQLPINLIFKVRVFACCFLEYWSPFVLCLTQFPCMAVHKIVSLKKFTPLLLDLGGCS